MRNYIFLLDVDGVMTTGQFFYSEEGKVFKVFGAHDHDGLNFLKDKLQIKFITADKKGFAISKKRISDEMGYEVDLVSNQDRFEYIKDLYGFNNLIYMGDGYYDAKIIKACMFGIAPNNARRETKDVADYVTESNSGEGAVLDACLQIMKVYFKQD